MLRNSANNFSIFTTKSAATDLILSKIRNVYNVCMNTEELEMHFKVFLERFLYFEDTLFDWRLFLYKARKYGLKYDMLFKFRVIEDEDDAFLRVCILLQQFFLLNFNFRLSLLLFIKDQIL